MHVMYSEPSAQFRNNQAPNTLPEYQPVVSPARQPAKKRRVLSPSQHLYNHQQHSLEDNAGYKVMKTSTGLLKSKLGIL